MRNARLLLLAAVLLVPVRAAADAECFPACRCGYVCSPQGQCVSACNPPCGDSQACTNGECVDRHAPQQAAAPQSTEPARPFEITLGVGAQKGTRSGASWGATPEAAFAYTLTSGRAFELFVGGRVRYDFDASVGAAGGEIGVRGVVPSTDASVRGGLFASLRPEIAFGNLTHPSLEAGIAGAAAVGPFVDFGPVVIRVPFMVQGIYSFSTQGSTHSLADIMISGEAGIRF